MKVCTPFGVSSRICAFVASGTFEPGRTRTRPGGLVGVAGSARGDDASSVDGRRRRAVARAAAAARLSSAFAVCMDAGGRARPRTARPSAAREPRAAMGSGAVHNWRAPRSVGGAVMCIARLDRSREARRRRVHRRDGAAAARAAGGFPTRAKSRVSRRHRRSRPSHTSRHLKNPDAILSRPRRRGRFTSPQHQAPTAVTIPRSPSALVCAGSRHGAPSVQVLQVSRE